MNKYHRIDRWVAALSATAGIASLTYFIFFTLPGKAMEPRFLVYMALAMLFSITVSALILIGIWRHKRWAFGLTAGFHAFSIISAIFFTVYEQVSNVQMPTSSTTILNWHDIYNLPISIYCAYRYRTFNQIENAPQSSCLPSTTVAPGSRAAR